MIQQYVIVKILEYSRLKKNLREQIDFRVLDLNSRRVKDNEFITLNTIPMDLRRRFLKALIWIMLF